MKKESTKTAKPKAPKKPAAKPKKTKSAKEIIAIERQLVDSAKDAFRKAGILVE